MTLVEICVDDLEGVERATAGGAHRIELCREVSCGGLTPPENLVTAAVERAPAGGMQVLVRPRPGDFIHSREEVFRICSDIVRLRQLCAETDVPVGFVVGVLNADHTINEEAAVRVREAAEDCPLTFHRAFDQVPNISLSLEALIRCGYDRVLTTGGHPHVAQYDTLAAMVQQVGSELIILASGGLRAHNVTGAIAATAVREVHMRAPGPHGHGTSQKVVEEIMRQVRGVGPSRLD